MRRRARLDILLSSSPALFPAAGLVRRSAGSFSRTGPSRTGVRGSSYSCSIRCRSPGSRPLGGTPVPSQTCADTRLFGEGCAHWSRTDAWYGIQLQPVAWYRLTNTRLTMLWFQTLLQRHLRTGPLLRACTVQGGSNRTRRRRNCTLKSRPCRPLSVLPVNLPLITRRRCRLEYAVERRLKIPRN